MALVLSDRVKETTATTGTATYTLSGAVNGFETFASVGDGNTTYYACVDGTDFEVGIGTFTASGTTLARTTILQSSNSDAAVSWGSGTKTIFCTQPAEKAVFLDASGHIIASDGRNLTNVDAATLDSLDSTSFLRSDAADTKTSGDLTFSDDVKAIFGTGSDLEIFHNGSNSIIKDGGTGVLALLGSEVRIQNSGGTENIAKFITDGAVELYHDHSKKLETTSTGATITGVLTADGIAMGDSNSGNSFANRIKLGAGNDLRLFHDGSNSFVGENGSGGLYITGSSHITFQSSDFGETYAKFNDDGAVSLRHNNSVKFETSSTGATVTGQLVATSLDISGDVDVDGTLEADAITLGGTAVPSISSTSTLTNKTLTTPIINGFSGTGNGTITGDLTVNSTDAGSTVDPTLKIFRNSSSPANQDVLGAINFQGRNNNSETINYAFVQSRIRDVTDGSENGALETFVETDGSLDLYTVHQDGQSQFYKDVALISSDAGATENPTLDLYRNSASPADGDVLGHIAFNGENSADEKTKYAEIEAKINDVTDGTEDGKLDIRVMSAGSDSLRVSFQGNAKTKFVNRDVEIGAGINLLFEGSSDDTNETTLTVVNPTSDRTITLPDATGTVALNESGILNLTNSGSQSEIRLYCENSNAHYAALKAPVHSDLLSTGNTTLTLPAATGTVLSTANADVATTTTNSSDADHVLINDGGVLKKITPTDLGIGSGGGGASNLNGLSDVTISSLQNNDLLKYNSTAGEWQNTNLGITVDPSLTFPANVFTSTSTTVTVAPSSGSYDAVAYFAEVRNNANDTTLVTNANITKTATSLTFTAPSSAGTYKLRVKAQDFGDLESEFVVGSFTVGTAQPRYYRIYGSGGSSHTMVDDIEFFTGTGQSGTKYPDAIGNMTSATAPSPLVASSSGAYSLQTEGWKAFDSSTTTDWWNLGNNSTYGDWYIELDIGVFNVTLQSAKVLLGHSSFYGGTQDLIMKSSTTGAFSGEETTLGTTSNGGSSGTFNIN